MSKIEAIRAFFEKDGGRKVETRELMELRKAPASYDELAALAAAALGVELTA